MKTRFVAVIVAVMVAATMLFGMTAFAEPAENEVTIRLANYDTENSFTVACIKEFIKYVEEASGGTIKFDAKYGGTLCSMPEEYDYLKSGSVDMVACLPPFYMAELPYIYAVNNVVSDQDIVDFTNWLWFENEATAPLVQKYTEAAGVVLLGTVDAGTSIIATSYPASTFEDLKGNHTLGGARDADVYISMGINVANVDTTDAYDSLQRGVCDAYAYTPSSYYTNNIYEVAPYIINFELFGNSNTYIISADKWAQLTEEQQQIMRDGMKAAQEYSVKTNIQSVDDANGVAKGNATIDAETSKDLCQAMELANNTMLMGFAENLGTVDDFMTFIKAKEEYTGLAQTPEGY